MTLNHTEHVGQIRNISGQEARGQLKSPCAQAWFPPKSSPYPAVTLKSGPRPPKRPLRYKQEPPRQRLSKPARAPRGTQTPNLIDCQSTTEKLLPTPQTPPLHLSPTYTHRTPFGGKLPECSAWSYHARKSNHFCMGNVKLGLFTILILQIISLLSGPRPYLSQIF